MFDAPANRPLLLSNATLVTPDGLLEGGVMIDDGKVAEIGATVTGGQDLTGQILSRGLSISIRTMSRHMCIPGPPCNGPFCPR